MSGSRIAFILTGSIAGYKACAAISQLVQRGHRVRPVDALDPTVVGCAQVIAVDHGGALARGGTDPRSPEGDAVGR